MRIYNILLTITFLTVLKVNASELTDTIIIRSDNSTEKISRDLDSLVTTWYVKIAINPEFWWV